MINVDSKNDLIPYRRFKNLINVEKFQEMIGYTFENVKLLFQAISTKAFLVHNRDWFGHKDALATMGDAVISVFIIKYTILQKKMTEKGHISRYKDQNVQENTLATLMKSLLNEVKMESSQFFLCDKGEILQNVMNNDHFLAEAFESITGAIFLDGGLEKTEKFLLQQFHKSSRYWN